MKEIFLSNHQAVLVMSSSISLDFSRAEKNLAYKLRDMLLFPTKSFQVLYCTEPENVDKFFHLATLPLLIMLNINGPWTSHVMTA